MPYGGWHDVRVEAETGLKTLVNPVWTLITGRNDGENQDQAEQQGK